VGAIPEKDALLSQETSGEGRWNRPLARPRVVSLLTDRSYDLVFSPEAEATLGRFADFHRRCRLGDTPSEETMIAQLQGADALLTSWGTTLSTRMIAETDLRIIGHIAGSVKGFPPLVWERGIAVVHAAPVIAVAVGEMALALTLACLRHIPEHDDAFKRQGTRGDRTLVPRLLATRSLHGLAVGIVGMGGTGRQFLKLLRAFGDVDVWASDPYLGEDEAARLGVRLAPLDRLLASCDVVSLHCPALPETHHLINAGTLKLLKDGAVLINTARGALIDHAALLEELQSGRISAGLDVYLETCSEAQVPLSAYRELRNVVVTPGIAGPAGALTKQMSRHIAEELERFFRGQPLRHPVTAAMLPTMA
jgi:phosphoglycerate dehydrogenase-like enzyme